MQFSVHPAEYRRVSRIFCIITLAVSLLEVLLTFCGIYWGRQTQGVAVWAFVISAVLAAVAWRACSETIQCHEYVEIMPDRELVILYSAAGKAVRTFRFSDIRDVRSAKLPTLTYVAATPRIHRYQYICVSTALLGTSPRAYVDVRNNPDCIVFSYNKYAYEMLHGILLQQTGNID